MSNLHRLHVHVPHTEEILQQLYSESFFLNSERPCYRKSGSPGRWGLDLRKPLSQGKYLSATCSVVAGVVESLGAVQIAGTGCAAAYLVAGLVAQNPMMIGGLIRKQRKQYGFREIVEGGLQHDKPIVLIDDILASGTTLCEAISILRTEGFNPVAAVTLFEFIWYQGAERLTSLGVKVHPLSSLSYRKPTCPKMNVVWQKQDVKGISWEKV